MIEYSMWLLEYAYIPALPVSVFLASEHNKGDMSVTYTYTALVSDEHKILIDCGTDNHDPYCKALCDRDNVCGWQSPEAVLEKIGLKPEDIDTIIFTHAHYDHLDNLCAFPNAHYYIQSRELMGWLWAAGLDQRYSNLTKALNPNALKKALHMVNEGRMTLLDGKVDNLLPGIHVEPAYDGHSYASQIVTVNCGDGVKHIIIGDLAYSSINFTGTEENGHAYIPIGLLTGSQFNFFQGLDRCLELADNDFSKILIGHETGNWTKYPSKLYGDGLHVAELALRASDKSILE